MNPSIPSLDIERSLFRDLKTGRRIAIGLRSPMHQAAELVDSLVENSFYPLLIERDGVVLASGYIELTATGYHCCLLDTKDEPLLAFGPFSASEATWAIGKYLKTLERREVA